MMTQFFQVLKRNIDLHNVPYEFYDDSILSGTKTRLRACLTNFLFYDDSILSGTKTVFVALIISNVFYDDSILSGTKTSNTIFHINVKQLYLSFA